ncbi:mandelate racemase/muconate lactonizing enzyme family protein, partial [Candidatus Pelagibacter sp.]|nr:mandelate racemase/muconate lactonizing enzyme family protein [Candidatus Pelagibacter sp.]
MSKIENIRTILLSAEYGNEKHPEILECFPNGPKRTIGLVEVTLENGVKGYGEGYLGVFAPKVFKSIVELCAPYLIGKNGFDILRRYKDLCSVCDYWSLQGAARHTTSAIETALVDAKSKTQKCPAYKLFGNSLKENIEVYGSGGICDTKEHFIEELELLKSLGIKKYKIRAVPSDINRTVWVLNEARKYDVDVGIDMCQNLADPPINADDVINYINYVKNISKEKILFLEEAVGPMDIKGFKKLKETLNIDICGGEVITTPLEMIERINLDIYNFVQPDASVIGGMYAVKEVFDYAKTKKITPVVHAWGGPIAIMANYHVAFGCNGNLVEFPMIPYKLEPIMFGDQRIIKNGKLLRPEISGIGIAMNDKIEKDFSFDKEAVYSC